MLSIQPRAATTPATSPNKAPKSPTKTVTNASPRSPSKTLPGALPRTPTKTLPSVEAAPKTPTNKAIPQAPTTPKTPTKTLPEEAAGPAPNIPTQVLPGATPIPATPKKKTPRKDINSRGLKWFKKSHKKSSTKHKLLKSAQREGSPVMVTPIPPRVVEFEIEGTSERLGVLEPMGMIDKCSAFELDLPPTPSMDWQDDNTNTSFPNSPIATTVISLKKSGKGKGVLKPKSHKKGASRIANGDVPTTSTNSNDSGPGTSQPGSSLQVKLPDAQFRIMEDFEPANAPPMPNSYIRYMETPQEELADEVEYDLDEEDFAWLELVNEKRRGGKSSAVKAEDMELLMDRLEKESHFQMQSTGMDHSPPIDDDAVCCICMDGECQNSNAILFCDMCNLAVHQECYGVPYIPEGQWLCRRCLQSPSRAVDCVLCPNKCGAFKQTDDGRWAHVVCALWIPEVCFSNPVFLEPVDSVGNIPAARWRLTCFICKQKGVGACIQCYKSNCYIAFHVTCAQQANLCMKMDTVRDASSVIVKKTAYCDNHAPPELLLERKRREGTADDSSPRQKMKQTRKLLAEKRDAIPLVSIPTIPPERVTEISIHVSFTMKKQFMKRLMAYWKLKRQTRNGVPLLRRLQASSHLPSGSSSKYADAQSDVPYDPQSTINYYKYWLRLRQDLETARLLCELIRKREKLKRQLIHANHRHSDLTLRPLNMIYLNVLEELRARDPQDIFFDPVDTSEVTDYLTIVTQPMDIFTMTEKVNSYQYNSIDDLEQDFNLMISNCLSYNQKDTVFYKAGVRLREMGGVIIRHARRSIESIGFDPSGRHLGRRNFVEKALTDAQILEDIEELLADQDRFDLPFDDHINQLQDILDKSLSLTHTLTRKKKVNRIKQEIFRIRRLKTVRDTSGSTHKKYKSALASATKKPNMNLSCVGISDTESVESHPTPRRRSLKADLNLRTPPRRPLRGSVKTAPNLKAGRELRPLKRKAVLKGVPESPSSTPRAKLRVRPARNDSVPATPARESVSRVLRRSSIVSITNSSPVVPFPISFSDKPLFTTIPNPVEYPKVKPLGVGFDAWKRKDSPRTPGRTPRRAAKVLNSPVTPPAQARNVKSSRVTTNTPAGVRSKVANVTKPKDVAQSMTTELTPRKKPRISVSTTSNSKKSTISNSKPNSASTTKNNSVGRNERRKSSTRSPSPRLRAKVVLENVETRDRLVQLAVKKTQDVVDSMRAHVKIPPPIKTQAQMKKPKVPLKSSSSNSNLKKSSKMSLTNFNATGAQRSPTKSPTRSPSPRRCLLPALSRVEAKQERAGGSDYEPWVPELSTCPHAHANNLVDNVVSNNVNNIRKPAAQRKKKESLSNAKHIQQLSSRGQMNPDSFMTYRSVGGDGVSSNSNSEAEDEEEADKSAEEALSSFESSIPSSPSSSEEEPAEIVDLLSSSDSERDSDNEPVPAAPVVVRSSSDEDDGRSLAGKSSESSSSSSSSSTSSSSSSTSSSSSSASESSDAGLHQTKHTKPMVHKDRRNGSSSVKERERSVRPTLTPRRHKHSTKQPPRGQLLSSPEPTHRLQQPHRPLIFRQERLEDSDDGAVEPLTFNRTGYEPKIMDLVWTRVKESSWYPALICRPNSNGWSKNGVTIPGPPLEVLAQKPKDTAQETFLVLFFDTQRTWEWVEASRLEPLGQNPGIDKQHLDSIKLPEKKTVRKAYERAILHKGKVTGQPQNM